MEARVSSEKDTLSTNLFSKLDRLNVCDHLPMHCRLVVYVYLVSLTIFAKTDLLDQPVSDGMFNSVKQGTLSG